jgi:hypothetical protein
MELHQCTPLRAHLQDPARQFYLGVVKLIVVCDVTIINDMVQLVPLVSEMS